MASGKDEIRVRDQRTPGWFWCQNELLDEYAPRVGVFGIAVYCALARNSRNDVASIWMSAVAATLHCSRRKVAGEIARLVALGLIQKQSGAARGVANTYILCDLKPAQEGMHKVRTPEQTAVGYAPGAHPPCTTGSGGVHQLPRGYAPGAHTKTDYKTQDSKTGESAAASAAPTVPPAEAVILLPLNDGTEFSVTEAHLNEWRGLYQGTDVLRDLRAMRGWLLANPKNRKTRSGVLRFVTAWLAKEQNRAPAQGGKNHGKSNGNGLHFDGDMSRYTRDLPADAIISDGSES